MAKAIKKNIKPLVSIIIPIYNVEQYLEKCINSVLKQDYDNIEIILVNDGSPDRSFEICKKYKGKDNRVIVIDKPNGGVSSARNAGLEKATGEYVIFIDADDWLDNDFVSYMVKLAQDNMCDFALSLNCYKTDNEINNEEDYVSIITPAESAALMLSMRLEVGCWNKIYKKSVIDDNNLRFNEKLFFGEGLFFITMFAQLANKTAVGQKRVYHYRQDNYTSATKKYDYKKFVNGEKSLDLINKSLKFRDEKVIEQLNIHYYLFFFNAVVTTCVNNQMENHKEEFEYWRQRALKQYALIKKSNQITFIRKHKTHFIIKYPKLFLFLKRIKSIFKK